VRELRLAEVLQPAPATDRIFFHAVWFRGHNNPRYAALLPRLDRLDAYLLTCSDHRILRGLQFRAYRRTEPWRNSFLLARMSRRYRGLLCVDSRQAEYFDGPVVADVDDPKFTTDEVERLGHRNIAAYVVTGEQAAQRYQELGLSKPYIVIPQGVDLDAVSSDRVEQVRAQHRRAGDTVVGYVAAWLVTAGDRDGDNPLFNIDHLLQELWPAIREKVPGARLWLIGQASPRVEQLCAGRSDVLLLGRLSQAEVLNHVAAFDIALYPRRVVHTVRTVKVAEYMGLGIPTVSYDLEIVEDLEVAGGGLLVTSPAEFVDAVANLAVRLDLRAKMGAAAREYASGWRWNLLAERYREVLDQYLPR
jgi:glycosyltransferase involved in cell wall biosynthesis